MMKKRGFTLVEILVVVSIIAMVIALTIPSIKAIQTSSARAEAYNTINAALQGVRSYAIMNQVKTAARFQPNGKVVFVYRFEGNANSEYVNLGSAADHSYPQSGTLATGVPNADGYIYLPVLDQEPLKMPNGYAASRVAGKVQIATTTRYISGLAPLFYEPFYVCYNPDGTLAVDEPIWVALIENASHLEPVNPDFNGNNNCAWHTSGTYAIDAYSTLSKWLDFTQDKTETTSINDVDDHKLARYFYVATSEVDLKEILDKNQDLGIDHYAGGTFNITITVSLVGGGTHSQTYDPSITDTRSVSQIAIFKTPDNWSKRPLFDTDDAVETQTKYVQDELSSKDEKTVNSDIFETIFINPYTGRVIRENQ
jgi:prepilin-type N-terminal cleavage/methylation domain-containing protein